MADTPVSIAVPGPAHLRLTTRSGKVTVSAEARDDVLIEAGAPRDERIERDATGGIAVTSRNGGSADLAVRCPAGSDLSIGTISGTVELRGTLGRTRVTTVSGSVRVERAEALDVRSISGHIEVKHCDGRARLQTKSGHATCGTAGKARVSTISGNISLGDVEDARAQSVSGTVDIGLRGAGDVAVQTMSGSVRVEVPPDVHPDAKLRSLAGRPRCDCARGTDCQIAVRSLSGKIEVVNAP